MKKFVVSVLAFGLATSAFAQQRAQRPGFVPMPQLIRGELEHVSCRDARPIADGGLEVRVTKRGQANVITVGEQSFVGPRLIGQLFAREFQDNRRGNTLNYQGRGAILTINMDTPVINNSRGRPTAQGFPGFNPGLPGGDAFLGLPAFIRGSVNGVRLDHDLRCVFIAHAL